jgi:hypothetical protein
MTERSQSCRAVVLLCGLPLSTGCMVGQDVAVSGPSDVATAAPAIVSRDALTAESGASSNRAAKQQDIALPSDGSWDVYSGLQAVPAAYLGKAQRVCSNATSPSVCPAGAIDYGYGGTDWAAHIDACEGNAHWIWAPGVTGASAPAELAEYYFVSRVSVPNRPTSAQVHVAVDDQAEVIVNGAAMGTIGSTTDSGAAWANQSKPTAIDIAGALVVGTNTITIRAANGSGVFTNCTNCTYQQNPAGVIFCVDIRY